MSVKHFPRSGRFVAAGLQPDHHHGISHLRFQNRRNPQSQSPSARACPRASRSGAQRDSLGPIVSCLALAFCLGLSACSTSVHSSSSNAAAAQPAAALAGYVFDGRIQGLRPVAGTLGAAHLESPIGSLAFASAIACPSGGFALAADSSGNVFSVALPSAQPTRIADPVASHNATERIVLSPSCANALVYSPATGAAVLLTGLPSAAHVQSIALPVATPGAAVSDTGSVLYGAPNADGTTSLRIATGAASPASVLTLQKLGGLAFLRGADTAIVADALANTVSLGTRLTSAPAFTTLAASAQGVAGPRAVAASADSHYAFLANGNTLLRIDLTSSAAPVPIPCHCTATELLPLAGNASFQITDPAAGIIYALQGDGTPPRTLFIPTDSVSAATGGAQ